MSTITSTPPFTLDNFEGPLDFLLHLVQQAEIDIYEIPIQKLIDQFLRILRKEAGKDVDQGAEFLALAAQLMLIKSRTLLPKHEQDDDSEEELDPKFEVIHALLEYCKFRDAGKELARVEDEQTGHHFRGLEEETKLSKLPNGVDHLSLDELSVILAQAMARAASKLGDDIEEEEYRVIDKIREIRRNLKIDAKILLADVFSKERSPNELIVYFLAMLEMMKLGELAIIQEESGVIYLTPQTNPKERHDQGN